MKLLEIYRKINLNSNEDIFQYFLNNLKETIRTYDFYVAWNKVLGNVQQVEVSLNIMNSLIGKADIAQTFEKLILQYPEIVPIIPLLIAVRDSHIKIADLGGDIDYSFSKQKSFTHEETKKIVFFAEKCGLLNMLAEKNIKNLVDYAIGVEVGLDTNARKNRSGTTMEKLCEVYVHALCEKHGYKYIAQATASKIKTEFNKEITTDKADRAFDFAIDTGKKLYLLEVNYYSGGGSKLKAVAGEFVTLNQLVKNDTTNFIWITDGLGWHTAAHPLRETFNATDFVLNIKMLDDGILEEIITKGL